MRAPLASLLSPTKLTIRRSNLIARGCSSVSGCQSQDFYHYHKIKNSASTVSPDIIPHIFKSLANLHSLEQGSSLHADAIKMGFDSFTSTCNSIMSFYIKCGVISYALNLFDCMLDRRDSVSWNVVIHGVLCSREEDYELGLALFCDARGSNFAPNASTLIIVLQACWRLGNVSKGQNIHGFIIKSGDVADVPVHNSLLTMYVKSQDLDSAQKLFDEMRDRDVISLSALISGHAQFGSPADALQLFRSMHIDGTIQIDRLAAVSVLQACTGAGDINNGRLFHGHLIRGGFEHDVFIGNSLIDMYSKCYDVHSAIMAFNQMLHTNIVSWNSILTGLVHNEKFSEVLALFDSMRNNGVEGDEVTIVNLLHACKRLGLPVYCRCIHSLVLRRLFEVNDYVLSSLLDAYSKCKLMDPAVKLFETMQRRDVVSWSTMIAGLAHCGRTDEAVALFSEMQMANEVPNSITMLGLLESAAVSAALKLSKAVHCLLIRNYFSHDLTVGSAVVDMYGKCGDLNSSRKVFDGLPQRNISVWNAMIGALGINSRASEALAVLNDMELDNVKPNGITMLSIMSACSHGGLVEDGLSCFKRMLNDPLLYPSLEHYSCIVDMLARAGNLQGAVEVIKRMAKGLEASPAAWSALLSACRSYGNMEMGENAAARVIELEPANSAGYLASLSVLSKSGSVDEMARMRWLMRERRLKIISGYSLVHVDQRAHRFVAWDGSHPAREVIYLMIDCLHARMKLVEQ